MTTPDTTATPEPAEEVPPASMTAAELVRAAEREADRTAVEEPPEVVAEEPANQLAWLTTVPNVDPRLDPAFAEVLDRLTARLADLGLYVDLTTEHAHLTRRALIAGISLMAEELVTSARLNADAGTVLAVARNLACLVDPDAIEVVKVDTEVAPLPPNRATRRAAARRGAP